MRCGSDDGVRDNRPAIHPDLIENKKRWHAEERALPLNEKFAILLKLQAQSLPFIARLRPLKPHEKVWNINP